ncbi:uncharacterized protein ALTATR162_LOCUS6854 [Alternaria atra]|uniref:Uncharacterized protein n=1 Tax=Alternaria atra TaxID=119953 RepID=A0A8J2I2D9_9PLEO|nr:uncharacterized protein ALTATR162_LOCUS6854 [Alternaria atra]CAG5165872.1 unnamed protein product [Alternaria atra]
MSQNQPYDDDKQMDGLHEERLLLQPQNWKRLPFKEGTPRRSLALHALTFLLAIAITTLLGFLIRPFPPQTPRMKTLHCGTNSTTARELNCTYDVLSNIWVPNPCLDKKNLDDFKRLAKWQAYETREAKRLLTEDEMGDVVAPNTYFTEIREHMVHCALMWRRLHRGYQEDQKYLDLHVRALTHTKHCSQLMIDYLEKPRSVMDLTVSQTSPGFSICHLPA